MMDKQGFLAQRLSSINNVFDDSIENIEDTCYQVEKSGNVIREQLFVYWGVSVAIDAGDY